MTIRLAAKNSKVASLVTDAPPAIPEAMKPAYGIVLGLALSAVFWLALVVVWLSF